MTTHTLYRTTHLKGVKRSSREKQVKWQYLARFVRVRLRFMCRVQCSSLISDRYFNIFCLWPLGVSRETFERTKHNNSGSEILFFSLQFALPHNATPDTVTSLTEVLMQADFVNSYIWRLQPRLPAAASLSVRHSQRKLLRQIYGGIQSKWGINISCYEDSIFKQHQVSHYL